MTILQTLLLCLSIFAIAYLFIVGMSLFWINDRTDNYEQLENYDRADNEWDGVNRREFQRRIIDATVPGMVSRHYEWGIDDVFMDVDERAGDRRKLISD